MIGGNESSRTRRSLVLLLLMDLANAFTLEMLPTACLIPNTLASSTPLVFLREAPWLREHPGPQQRAHFKAVHTYGASRRRRSFRLGRDMTERRTQEERQPRETAREESKPSTIAL